MQRGCRWCVFLMITLGSLGAWAGSEDFSARVRWVVDGDTIILHNGQTVRLMGLDAPELSREDQPGQYYAQQSRERAFRLMDQTQVVVHPQGVDRFDRLVARVHLADGTWVGKALVAGGAAFVYPSSEKNPTPDTRLLSAQRRAMERKLGFWKTLLSLPRAGDIYIGNQRSKKFHSRGCSFGQSIYADNRRPFTTLEQAFYAGYAPGRCCTPWPSRVDVQKMKGE
ncbi:MAG: thermonuclease family protein [Desulfovermiculus sp.]